MENVDFSGVFVPLVACKGVEKLWKSGRYYWWKWDSQ